MPLPPLPPLPRAFLRPVLLAALAALAAAGASARGAAAQPAMSHADAPPARPAVASGGDAAQAAAAGGGAAARRPVRPGDVVRVRIWREPDLSGEFPVEVSGRVVLPKLGPRDAAGAPAGEFERAVAGEFAAGLSHESVAVTVLRRIQITGAVRTPGLYPLDPTVTVDEALAVAGGPTGDGRSDRVQLVRGGRQLSVRLARGTRLADSPIESGDQLRVPERGWLNRNTAITTTLLSVAGSVLLVRMGQ